MTRKKTAASLSSTDRLIQLLPLIGVIFLGGGFYFSLKDIPAKIEAEDSAREKLRDALLSNSQVTQKSIDSLAAHALVQDEQIKNVNSSLERVVSGLQTLNGVLAAKSDKPR